MRFAAITGARAAPRRVWVLLGLPPIALAVSCGPGRPAPAVDEHESPDAAITRPSVSEGETAPHIAIAPSTPGTLSITPAIQEPVASCRHARSGVRGHVQRTAVSAADVNAEELIHFRSQN